MLFENQFEKGVECYVDEQGLFYSTTHTDRAVLSVPFGGWVMYERMGEKGQRIGVTNQKGAIQWLSGEPKESIDYRLIGKMDPLLN